MQRHLKYSRAEEIWKTKEEISAIKEPYEEYRRNGAILQTILRKKGFKISKNKIHEVLKMNRYERWHSMELWHADWFYSDGKWIIAYLDDASHFIAGYGVLENATSENAIKVLKGAMNDYGKPESILTDRGTQFYASAGKKVEGLSKILEVSCLEWDKVYCGRVNHPQTNGKIARFFGLMEQKLHLFDTIDKFIEWYNCKRSHMSLNLEELETPYQVFLRKLPPERVLGYCWRWFDGGK